jgi:hypothetical protein
MAREAHVNSIKAAPVPFCLLLVQLFAIDLTIILIISKLEKAIWMRIHCSQYSGSIQEHIQVKCRHQAEPKQPDQAQDQC